MLKQIGMILGAAVVVLISGSLMFCYAMIPYWSVKSRLKTDGYTQIDLSHAWWNRAPISCSGDDVSKYTYTARKASKDVTGFACYRGPVWGVAYWDN